MNYKTPDSLELAWIAEDCHWVVVTPSGHLIGPRFFDSEQANDFLDGMNEIWHQRDSSESENTDEL
jgi:hypothetical protein